MPRFFRLLASLLPLTLPGFLAPPTPPDEHRFRKVDLTGNLTDLVDMDIAANGDVYLIATTGAVRRYRPRTRQLTELGTLPVNQSAEARLQAIALDPDFARNHFVYLYYATPKPDTVNRLARFVVRGDSLDKRSARVLLDVPDTGRCCHAGGSMAFDQHGNLYLTTGDNTNPFGTNYSPADERPDRTDFDAQRTSGNTDDLRGKILRIRPTADGSYTIPPGNLRETLAPTLSAEQAARIRPEIYIMGCRNPYRLTPDRDRDALYWSEVGPDASDATAHGPRGYDELNRATEAGNHGWPYVIGPGEAYAKVDFRTDSVLFVQDPARPVNTSPRNTGLQTLPPARPPLLWYPYDHTDRFPHLGAGGRTCIVGPIYYFDANNPSPIKFPAYFNRKLWLADWMRNWINVLSFDGPQALAGIEPFMPSTRFRKPISLKFGPDGALYVLEFGALWGGNRDSRLVRIEYVSGNRPPVARLHADHDAGAAPLTVHLTAAPSTDYDADDRLTYRWTINGRPVQAQSVGLTHTFGQPGTYRVAVQVRDRVGATAVAQTTVCVGNAPPQVLLTTDATGLLQTNRLAYRAQVADPEDGSVAPERVRVAVQHFPTSRALLPDRAGALSPSPYARGLTWLEESDCKGCHALATPSVGPSFRAIAGRYRASRTDGALVEKLAQKILTGGRGVWGEANMSAHPQVALPMANEMVRYILSLTDDAPQPLPGTGTLPVDPTQPGTYRLTATYTDRGTAHAKPLTRQQSVVLRTPVWHAPDFDEVYEAQQRAYLTDIKKGGWAVARRVDLTGIRSATVTLFTQTPGTTLELHADRPDGPLLGTLDLPVAKTPEAWADQTIPLLPATGSRDLYLVFKNRLYVLNMASVRALRLH